ncbi:tRNA-Ile-lysidine synthase [Chrysochromulina ericina virus CeV-01B]|jgi:tRNA(Ile)-lysidine synthetase-like protein|uniref:tRNA(Ile)-lysidine synthetase n=1 Tax=Chrysochromulina ericina virus CeV-01B TaxID=3070830 RepID=A0A0N7G7K4_9VIRU|nr:tRNA-Ile-lysidine synthase [Chrysochromulina ericina virus]ALH23033.1 tRNA-Ile-lysidine synthase [Chrysochromulina ericina virus CeV-01B]
MNAMYGFVKTTLYNLIYNDKLYNIDFDKYKNILEYVPNVQLKIQEQNIADEEIMKKISEFCKLLDNKKVLVSLSGGVDSMVLITILHWLDFDIVAGHINYNNRNETTIEEEFLQQWCLFNNIKLYIKNINNIKRSTIKRSEYELITKNMRLDFYKEIIATENIDYVLLAHHKDDIIENVFANICRGRNYLDLAVIREHTTISEIKIGRPMINYYKTAIYEFAHKYQVPYFLDTTPKWSIRGKYRDVISPAIEDAFQKNVKENLISISDQADQWNSLIEKQIIQPFIEKIKINLIDNKTSIEFNIEKYINYPIAFWSVVFMNLFNQFGSKAPSKKSIQTFINTIKYRVRQNHSHKYNITLCNNNKCTIKNYNVTIEF